MKYPNGCNDAEKKTGFLTKLQEKLRIDHNTNGWTETWEKRHNAVIEEMHLQRALLKNSDKYNPDLEEAD
tara:strand:- start:1841 stop:2050 length:210 start_codon:yes stop_codon:yes gene_type:complete